MGRPSTPGEPRRRDYHDPLLLRLEDGFIRAVGALGEQGPADPRWSDFWLLLLAEHDRIAAELGDL